MRFPWSWPSALLPALGVVLLSGCESTPRDPTRPPATIAVSPAKATACIQPDSTFDPDAPTVTITDPHNINVPSYVPPDFTVHWAGNDADGHIREYRFRLFTSSNPDFPDIPDFIAEILSNPRQLEKLYGPCFDSWDRAPGSEASHTFHGLEPQQRYLFAITAIDDDGKHTQYFTNSTNVWAPFVVTVGTFGPIFTLSSGTWSYQYPAGSYNNDPSTYLDLSVSAGQTVTIDWTAQPQISAQIAGYRWGLDLTDLDRDGSRGAGNPPGRWSPRTLDNTSATVGPFAAGETHLFFVDVMDTNGLASLAIIRLNVIANGAISRSVTGSGG